jgi:hypothetical protein
MYGSGNAIAPIAGGAGTSVLAYTGTGSMLVPIIVATLGLAIGIALAIRNRMIRRIHSAPTHLA